MSRIAVSIIVPIYRAEKYLDKCIKSLLAQTMLNIEIILVDDGSPDSSGQICDDYARMDQRVKVIHQKNSGVSKARNHGIALATGEYIGFVDSDDWVSPNMYKILYLAGKAHHCDVVSCDFAYCFEDRAGWRMIEEKQPFPHQETICHADFLEHIYLPVIKGQIFTALWNKIYAKSLLVENAITFPADIPLREDYYFYMDIFTYAERFLHIAEPLYFYRCYPSSCSHRQFKDYFELSMALYESILAHMHIWGMDTEPYLKFAYRRCFELGIDSMGKSLSYQPERLIRRYNKVKKIMGDERIVQAAKMITQYDLTDETVSRRFLISALQSKNTVQLILGLFLIKMNRQMKELWLG